MKRGYLAKRIAIAAVTVCIAAMMSAGIAYAYYTDTSSAAGSVGFSVTPPGTEIEESFDGMNKDITIKNTGDVAVMVRFKALYPSAEFATVSVGSSSSNWVVLAEDDGWIYYAQPVMPGASTDQLDVNVVPNDDAPGNFDITVTQQFAVAYYEDGALTGQFGDTVVSLAEDSYTAIGPAEKL